MNRRLILSAFLVLCLSTGLLAQGKLGVYAAAFYNLENLWDTEDNPDNPGMMTLLRAVSTMDTGQIRTEIAECCQGDFTIGA